MHAESVRDVVSILGRLSQQMDSSSFMLISSSITPLPFIANSIASFKSFEAVTPPLPDKQITN